MSYTVVDLNFTWPYMHASPAWWGFATVADKQRIEAFLRRGVRLDLYSADDPTVSQCAADADDTLFRAVLANDHHVPAAV